MVSKAKIETTKPFMGGVWIVSGATQSNNIWVTISSLQYNYFVGYNQLIKVQFTLSTSGE